MSKAGRRAVADWIRRQADDFELLGAEYTDQQFIARYQYVTGKTRPLRARA